MILKQIIVSATIAAAVVLSVPQRSSYLDFTVGYWHPSRLLLEGNNPYQFCDLTCLGDSIDAVSLQRLNPAGMYVMYNPAVFPLFFPWAVLPFRAAALLYLFSLFFSVSLALQLLADRFTKDLRISSDARLTFWFLAVPVGLVVLNTLWGSPSWIALFGVVLFLVLFGRRPFVAGLFLSLTLVKIHLFLIFGAAVLACCLRRRNWLTPLGFALAASVSLLTAILFRPDILAIYAHVAETGQMFRYVNATVPSVARYLLSVNGSMYLVGPCLLLSAFAFGLFWWMDASHVAQRLCSVLPFSIAFAPYAWGHDYISATPVLVIAAAYVVDDAYELSRRRAMGLYLLGLNLFVLWLAVVGTASTFLQLGYGVGLMTIGAVAFRLTLRERPIHPHGATVSTDAALSGDVRGT